MHQITTFAEVDNYLKTHDSTWSTYSLDNIKLLMGFLGNPQNQFKAVHVAGTSGKTSTAYFMAAMLSASSKKTGLTVSPVIDGVSERLQINLKPLSEKELTSSMSAFINLLSKSNIESSRFEFMIAFSYWYFARQKVDYAVIEVGLGGLNDATNVISSNNKICLITDIGYDHTEILGDTLGKIASHKAGIIGPSNEVFMHLQPKEVMKPIESRIKLVKANLNLVKATPNLDKDVPEYQHRNWELAFAAYKFIETRDELKVKSGEIELTKHVQVPGRMDIKKYKGKTIVLDGAHNTQKMTAFIGSFKKLYPNTKPVVLIAMKSNKDYQEVAKQVAEIAARVITTTFNVYQDQRSVSLPAGQLSVAFKGIKSESIDDPRQALKALLNSTEETLIITGSLYLLSQLRSFSDFLK